jgi:leucyl/phenylalanyl-tRNA--protein transferase
MDIVAVTRELTVEDTEAAYRAGVFPMFYPEEKVFTWHCPDPRAILPLDGFHASRTLQKTIRNVGFTVTFDRDFRGVMEGCAEGRPVWIGPRFYEVYGELHRQGKAHSVEVRIEGKLVGGTYGVHLGGAFFAESKFHRVTDASKVALAALVDRLKEGGFALLDVQYLTPHLARLGVKEVPQVRYLRLLRTALAMKCVL